MTDDAETMLAEARAFERQVDRLEQLADATADYPVPELTREQLRALVDEHAGRPIEFVERFGLPLMASLSLRDRARVWGRSLKHEWLVSQVGQMPGDVFDELLHSFLKELPDHQRTSQNIFTRIIDVWRQQSGDKPIRDPDAPTHRCPNCGHRW